MLFHMFDHAMDISEETDMTQLVDLVVADGLEAHLLLDILQVVGGGGQGRDAAAGESDLGGGGEFIDHIRIAGPFALGKDLQYMVLPVIIQVVDSVGVIPENTEVLGGGLQTGQPADGMVRIGNTCRVGVLGNTPDALDGFIF